ncbi:MAG: hypothetical protein WAU59_07350, partial [Rhodoplanes sp.]
SSLSDAKSTPPPKSKIARKCTAFLRLQTLNSPTRSHEDPLFKINHFLPQFASAVSHMVCRIQRLNNLMPARGLAK